jgi:hypothetical protein
VVAPIPAQRVAAALWRLCADQRPRRRSSLVTTSVSPSRMNDSMGCRSAGPAVSSQSPSLRISARSRQSRVAGAERQRSDR